jgi:seryl-tRNA synthetase
MNWDYILGGLVGGGSVAAIMFLVRRLSTKGEQVESLRRCPDHDNCIGRIEKQMTSLQTCENEIKRDLGSYKATTTEQIHAIQTRIAESRSNDEKIFEALEGVKLLIRELQTLVRG